MAKLKQFKPVTRKEYEELRDKWYKKLKNIKDEIYPNGFTDIERDEDTLKVWSSDKFASRRLLQHGGWQAKATYNSMAERYLTEYPFESRREQIIWAYHTNAISVRDIVRLLRKVRIKMERTSVWEVIKKHKGKMFALYMADRERPRKT